MRVAGALDGAAKLQPIRDEQAGAGAEERLKPLQSRCGVKIAVAGAGAELELLLPARSLFNLNLTVIIFLFSISSSSSSRISSPSLLHIGFTRHRLTMTRFAPCPQNELKIWVERWFGPGM